MTIWFEITFSDNSTGFMRLVDGSCQNVYRADGSVVSPEEIVEYTCVNDNATVPSWYTA